VFPPELILQLFQSPAAATKTSYHMCLFTREWHLKNATDFKTVRMPPTAPSTEVQLMQSFMNHMFPRPFSNSLSPISNFPTSAGFPD